MPRSRNIKPSLFTNEILGTLDPIISLTFIGLWCLADRDGTLEDRPLRIKAELFPYREKLDINRYLTVLHQEGFLYRYVSGGKAYIQVVNFEKHQHPHHTEKAKGFPRYQGIQHEQVLTPLNNGDTPSDLLIPDSLIPDSNTLSDKSDDQKKQTFSCDDMKEVSPELAKEYFGYRKRQKAELTPRAWKVIVNEITLSGLTVEEGLGICMARGWRGVKSDWLTNGVAKDTRPSRVEII